MLTLLKNKTLTSIQYETYKKKYFDLHNSSDELLIEFNEIIKLDDQGNLLTKLNMTDDEIQANALRAKRQVYCFDLVNRGQVWYETLSSTQKLELQIWYKSWLDAPNTLIEPIDLDWL